LPPNHGPAVSVFNIGSGVTAPTMSYAVNGKQYGTAAPNRRSQYDDIGASDLWWFKP
jgi:hypothetical protein